MKATILLVPMLIASLSWTTGCAGKASETEVEQMCKNLVELRGANAADMDVSEEMGKCKADPMIREASKDAAACRIAAKDVDTFWNKCR